MKTFRKMLSNKNGFTLVELIVVIAIIGILVAIAVPRMKGFTDSAKQTNDEQLKKILVNSMDILIAKDEITFKTSLNESTTIDVTNTTDPTYGQRLLYGTPTTSGNLLNKSRVALDAAGLKALMDPLIDPKARISQVNTKIIITVTQDGVVSAAIAPVSTT